MANPMEIVAAARHREQQRTGGQASAFLTLRDYFAGQALTGLCANSSMLVQLGAGLGLVVNAYKYADAMLAERDKRFAEDGGEDE